MTDDINKASVDTGSAASNENGSGNGQTGSGETVPKSQYDELFAKMGKMGEEVGVYRQFYKDVEPLIDLLEKNPEIEQALISGKFDVEMAKAVLEGRITQEEATVVADAHQQVKSDMGKEAYDKATAEDVSAKVDQIVQSKLDEAIKPIIEKNQKEIASLGSKLDAQNRVSEAEKVVRDFISSTQDFGEYSSEVLEKMESNPGLSIVEAYERVKAHHIVAQAGQDHAAQNAQSMKDVAANARGGQGTRSGSVVTGDSRNQFIKMSGAGGLGLG